MVIVCEMAILFTNSKTVWLVTPEKIFRERMKPEGMQSYYEGTDFFVFSEGSSLPFLFTSFDSKRSARLLHLLSEWRGFSSNNI